VPRGRQRPRLRFTIADDAGDDQAGIVERCAKGVAERVAELAALVDRAGRRRCDMARNTAGEGELGEQLLHARLVLADVRVDLAVAPLQVGVGDQRGTTVARSGDVKHVQLELLDDPVQMHINEVLAWCRAPVTHDQRLHVRQLERHLQERVVVEIDLSHGQVVGGPPVGVHLPQQIGADRSGCHDCIPLLS